MLSPQPVKPTILEQNNSNIISVTAKFITDMCNPYQWAWQNRNRNMFHHTCPADINIVQ